MSCVVPKCWQGVESFVLRGKVKWRTSPSGNNKTRKSSLDSLSDSSGDEAALDASMPIDPLYTWPSTEELRRAKQLREALSVEEQLELSNCPEDIQHDLMMCRFLRGHGHEVSTALPHLQAHLEYRRKHHTILKLIRADLDPNMTEFDEAIFYERFKYIQDHMKMLQLPAKSGSNDGMSASILPIGEFHLQDLASVPEEEIVEWFMSLCEMRSLCLHNQSLKEGRLAKVVEARDCMGFSWSSFFGSPTSLRQVKIIITVAKHYPEFLGSLQLYNLAPGLQSIALLRRVLPKDLLSKMIMADQSDWPTIICPSRGLSPSAIHRWSKHIEKLRCGGSGSLHWQQATKSHPQVVRTVRVSRGQAFSWVVHAGCASRSASLSVCVKLLAESKRSQVPKIIEVEPLRHLTVKQTDDERVHSGTYTPKKDGVVLLEVVSTSSKTLEIFAEVLPVPSGWKGESAAEEVVAHRAPTPVARHHQSNSKETYDVAQYSYLIVGVLAAFLALFGQSFLAAA